MPNQVQMMHQQAQAGGAGSAQDLLSRMQFAQAFQSMGAKTQQQQQQAASSNSPAVNQVNSTANTTDVNTVGANDLIKLQLEQERHNRMLQMAQMDRQERAMMANQEALLKKQRGSLNGGDDGELIDV